MRVVQSICQAYRRGDQEFKGAGAKAAIVVDLVLIFSMAGLLAAALAIPHSALAKRLGHVGKIALGASAGAYAAVDLIAIPILCKVQRKRASELERKQTQGGQSGALASTSSSREEGTLSEALQSTSTPEENDSLACQVPDFDKYCEFDAYRIPNEGTPRGVKPHIEAMEPGWIVSTGTERSYFDLLFADESKCEGLIIRDINPKVKGFCGFLNLLLVICETKEEFTKLSERPIEDSQEEIRDKIQRAPISPRRKDYYLRYLPQLAECYLGLRHLPRNPEGVEYRKDDALYQKLRKYAVEGKIIATVGDMNDLTPLGNRKISVVDLSNIPDYCFIAFKTGDTSFSPRVIHTIQNAKKTTYRSNKYQSLSKDEEERMQLAIQCLISLSEHQSSDTTKINSAVDWYHHLSKLQLQDTECSSPVVYCKESLAKLESVYRYFKDGSCQAPLSLF